MLWKKERGSYTVEAAFIVPMVLGIAFMILYLILWHHDRCVLQADLQDRVFLMAEKEKKESGPIEELQKKMWIMTIDIFKCSFDQGKGRSTFPCEHSIAYFYASW